MKDLDLEHLERLCYFTLKGFPSYVNELMVDEWNYRMEEYKKACDSVLLSRAKDTSKGICVSGENVDGVYRKYSSEYLKWNLHCMLFRGRVEKGLSRQQEFDSWLMDNPEPEVKFR